MPLSPNLPSQPQACDQCAVSLHILPSQVVEQPASLAHHHQEASAAVMIAFVLTQMLGQMVDTFGEQRDLNLGGTGVAVMLTVLFDNGFGVLHSHTRTDRGYEERTGV